MSTAIEKRDVATPATEGLNEDSNSWLAVAQMDEEAILAEIAGSTIFEDLFYYEKGKPSITWNGIKWLARVMSKNKEPISVIALDIVEVHDHVNYKPLMPDGDVPCTYGCKCIATAVAKNMLTGERRPAQTEQGLLMQEYDIDQKTKKKLETKHWERDPKPREKAGSRAKRNAMRELMPELAITKAAERWKNKDYKPMKDVGHSQATEVEAGTSPAPSPTTTGTTAVPPMQPSIIEAPEIENATDEEKKILRSYTDSTHIAHWTVKNGSGTSTRLWKPSDTEAYWKFRNDDGSTKGDAIDLVAAITAHDGKLVFGGWVYTIDEAEGKILRRKL